MIKHGLTIGWVCLLGMAGMAQEEPGNEKMDTVFTGDYLEMISGDAISEFHLTGNVTVVGTNLNLVSDDLLITAVKKGNKDATVGEMGKITKIIATGNVKIKQEGRIAESGRAEFFPEEKKVILTENPVVTDQQGTVSGERISWFHGQRMAQVEGGKEKQVIVTLPSMPNLGYDPNAENIREEEANKDPSEENAQADPGVANPSNP